MRLAALLLVLAAVSAAQQTDADETPAFGLTSSQTWQVGQKPSVTLLFRRISFLDFRVYRVNDVPRFFESLKDPHQLGSLKPPVPTEQTVLERFHGWKRRQRAAIRDFFRGQFSHETRQALKTRRESDTRRIRMPLHKAAFAQAPLLNPNQLVVSWREMLPARADIEYRNLPVEVNDPGVYVVEAVNGNLRAYTIAIVTNIAIITKSFPGQVLAFVTDRATGRPLAESDVVVVSPGRPRFTGRTDANGLFKFAPAQREETQRSTILLASRGRDTGINEVEGYSLWQAHRTQAQGLVYTDRPVYRPGQKVYFKGIARLVDEGKHSVPRTPVIVRIQDQEGKEVYKRSASFNAFGSFSGEFDAPRSASLGHYSVNVEGGGVNLYGAFQVLEYKKPEYEVRVLPAEGRVVQGRPLRVTFDAQYFFGEPVSGARVDYVVHRSGYWSPLRYSDPDDLGDLESEYPEYYDYGGQQILEQQTRLDARGRAEVEIPTEVDANGEDRRYRIEARVTDAANREVSGNRSVVATYGEFLITSQASKYVYQPGETVSLRVRAIDYDEKPVSKPVAVEVVERKGRNRRPVLTSQVTTDAGGTAVFEFPAQTAGSYEIVMSAPDSSGRRIRSTAWVYVAGTSDEGYGFARVQLLPDRKSYAPGDTAKVLVASPVSDFWALVTVEAYGVYERRVLHSPGRSATFEFPIRETYKPNIFCSVAFIKGSMLYEASRKIKVPADDRRLNVEVVPGKERYKPNETAEWRISAKDGAGKPVSAEFSIGIVDEAIYGVRPDTTPSLMQVFYGPLWNHVGTTYSTWYYFQGWSGERALQLALRRPYTLSDFKAERAPVQPKVRKYFPDTIYWTPTVVTGADGTARVQMEFPDSITAWRATARGITRETAVGTGVQKVITRKNVILRLETPRFLIEKDQVVVSGIVHNYLPDAKPAALSLAVKGLEGIDVADRTATVASGGEARVDWRVRAASPGEATLTAKAITDEESDAIELPVPVLPAGTHLTSAAAGVLTGAATEAVLRAPEGADASARSLRITYSPSLAGSLFSAMDYLARFPYGCTEQIMSSFLPNIILRKAMADAGSQLVRDPEELDRKVRDGLALLYDMQHADGGWGWWVADENHPFMTAYVIDGLSGARAAGYRIDEARLQRGRESLLKQYREHPRAMPDLKTYMVHALEKSGAAPPALVDEVFGLESRLTALGRPYLAMLLAARKDPRASQVVSRIAANCRQTETAAWWDAGKDDLLGIEWDASKEATALSVEAILGSQPDSPLVPKAVRWLMEARTGYAWATTKQTAGIIRALTPYVVRTGELKPDYALRITVNGKEVLSRRVTPQDAGAPLPAEIMIPAPDPPYRIAVEKNGSGSVYWSAAAEYYAPGPMKHNGLRIEREYHQLVPEKTSSGEIVYRQEPFRGVANVGDLLLAQVTVSGDEWRYLMIEDPIPAGTEPVEREDLYRLKSRPAWWETFFSRREFRDNRVVLFRERLPRGSQSFHYLLKVIRPGSFQASPARVEPMYQPGNIAATPSFEFRIVEQPR